MLTSYQLALKHLSLNPGAGVTHISIGSSLTVFDLHHFRDTMTSKPSVGFSSQTYKYTSYLANLSNTAEFLDLNDPDPRVYIGQEKLQHFLEDVTKAMMIAILDGDAKRTTTVGIGTSGAKVDTFLNALKRPTYYDINGNVYGRDNNAKPWSNWYTSVGVCTPVSVARTDNVATVVTNPAHGLSTSYDDWGIIMNLNTGIATSFNISTSTHPNGVPINIVDATTFTYTNVGINTPTTAVTGIASVQVGWGGTSNNLHLHFT